jgi:DNA-binding NarL/FixJ family response regulator
MADLRLLAAASDPLARAGLAALLESHSGFHLVGQIDAGESFQSEIDVYQPDIIVWDFGWSPEINLDLLDDISGGDIGIIALVDDVETASAAWSSGARGILYRNTDEERLLASISAVAAGLAAIEPDFAGPLLPTGDLDEPVLVEELTPRELEVLQLLAEGLANRAIAQSLGISDHTVKFHVNAIMRKTGAQSRTAAVVQAMRLGLIAL